jgi:hypothetical protein
MQKKTLLYIFGIAAFLGLVLGAGFFANELRVKILAGPDKSQFEAEQSQLPALADITKEKLANQNNSGTPSPSAPKPPAAPAQEQPIPQPPQETPAADAAVPEEKKDSFSFAVLGDTQKFDPEKADGGLQQAVKNIKEKNVDLVMTEGDLLGSCDGGSGCEGKLNQWKNIFGDFFSKTYAVMGNHDRSGKEKSDKLWQKFFDLPQNGPAGYEELTYSYDFENSHFVVLNSEKPDEHKIDKTQQDWLEKDLNGNKKDNTFIFFHEPAYPVSRHIGSSLDVNPADRDALWKILKDKKVTAVFNGHEHIVSRKKIDGIYEYIFGNTDATDYELPKEGVADYSYQGKSYGIVEVKGKEVTVNTYAVNGNLLDSYKLSN